jgi:hypothetical protein
VKNESTSIRLRASMAILAMALVAGAQAAVKEQVLYSFKRSSTDGANLHYS